MLLFNIAHGNVLCKAHLVAQVILENNAGVFAQLQDVVLPQVNTIEQYAAFGGVV